MSIFVLVAQIWRTSGNDGRHIRASQFHSFANDHRQPSTTTPATPPWDCRPDALNQAAGRRMSGSKTVRDTPTPGRGTLRSAGCFVRLKQRKFLGSAQIDVKISFKGRQPNKESAAKPLCRYVSTATALHTKRNVILDAWRSLKRLNFALPIVVRKKAKVLLRLSISVKT